MTHNNKRIRLNRESTYTDCYLYINNSGECRGRRASLEDRSFILSLWSPQLAQIQAEG